MAIEMSDEDDFNWGSRVIFSHSVSDFLSKVDELVAENLKEKTFLVSFAPGSYYDWNPTDQQSLSL